MIIYPRTVDDDVVVLGIDPGGTHVGVSVACRYYVDEGCVAHGGPDCVCDEGSWRLHAPGWRVYATEEMTPDVFADWFYVHVYGGAFDMVTCERWALRGNMAKTLIGSEMETCQLIGYIKHTIRQYNAHRAQEFAAVQFESNFQDVRPGTQSVLDHEGIKLVSPKNPDHQRSSELHLWHTLITNGLVPGVKIRKR